MTTEQKSGAQISTKAFIQAVAIIFVLMMVSGVLTRVIPAGQYTRVLKDDREVIDPTSFQFTAQPDFPIWRWFTAPVEVLFTPDGLTKVIPIIAFILLVGTAFGVMDKSGILQAVISRIVKIFGGRKYALLLIITFVFMALGGFFGIFEEVIPLVPLMIGLAYFVGWDSLTGLGMSVLATNVGFSAAVFNPFTIGIAQKLAGLPLYSGAVPRIILFVVMYGILATFLTLHARKIERKPEASPVFQEDLTERAKYSSFKIDDTLEQDPKMRRAAIFLGIFFGLILLVLVAMPVIPVLSDIALPLTGLLFVIGGIGAGLISGAGRNAWKAAWEGFIGIAPAIPLLMMAASVKHIIASGGILDTILHWANGAFTGTSPFVATLLIYGLTLILELFISSGSAKAFLLVPILMPLADLVGVTRQVAVSAYTFGDGFSNMAYPTNAALLITLSLTVIPFSKWFKWVVSLWFWVILATVAFLGIAVAINYGPFNPFTLFDTMTSLIPASYEQSRSRFRDRADTIRNRWPASCLASHALPYSDDLTIDWISAEALSAKDKLFVLTTAQHGIEGYLGSAMLELFIEEYLPHLDPQTTGLLLAHAINPWGMKNWKRTNPNNVDLNRNFVNGDFAALFGTNPDYPQLAHFLSPQKALGNLSAEKGSFAAQTIQKLVAFGPRKVREAALMGQYTFPKGIYFGGQELQPETRAMMDLYRLSFADYKQIIHLDMHTGYGPRNQMTLVNSPREKMSATQTTAKYSTPRVAAANPEEFYTMNGDMIDWEYELVKKEFPQTHFFGATCEFGTFGESILAGARSLRITIFKNQANLFGGNPATLTWVDQEYHELYLPSASAWFEKAQSDARQTIDGVLGAEGYLGHK